MSSRKNKLSGTYLSLQSEGDRVRVCIHKGALAPYPVPPGKGALMDPREKLPKADGLVFAKTTKGKKLWVEVLDRGHPRVFLSYDPIPITRLECMKTSFDTRVGTVIRAVMQHKDLSRIAWAVEGPSQMGKRKRRS